MLKRTGNAIEEIVAKHHTYKQVDRKLIEEWYSKLNWDTSKVDEEREEIKATKNVGFTTEISANWSDICDIYEVSVRRVKEEIPNITLMGGHSSHSYINGTNVYFMYYYDVDCAPEEEINKYHNPINKIIVQETLKRGGSMCHHHGVGKHRVHWIEEEYGNSYYMLKTLKDAFDPKGIMNPGTVFPLENK